MALTTSRVWIDDRPRHLGRAAAALLVMGCAAVVICTVIWRDGLPGAAVRDPAPQTALAPSNGRAMPTTAALPLPLEAPAQAAPVRCPYQRLDFAFSDGQPGLAACVGATRVVLNGGTRTHIAEPDGTSVWRLQVDMAGSEVLSVDASAPGRSAYRCEQPACAGVSLTPRDAQGRRSLVLKDTMLATAVPGAEDTSLAPAQLAAKLGLSATLALPADREDARLSCNDGARIDVVEQRGANFTLCPKEFGVSSVGEGRRAFEFVGSEGDQLIVEMGADGTIARVQLGALRCLREACSGVATRAGTEPGKETGRSFSFFGLTLKDAQYGGPTATLTGSVVVPAL